MLGDAPRVDSALPISPLDPRQCNVKQEHAGELQSVHSSGEADYQVGSSVASLRHLYVPLGCSLPHFCLHHMYTCDGSWFSLACFAPLVCGEADYQVGSCLSCYLHLCGVTGLGLAILVFALYVWL